MKIAPKTETGFQKKSDPLLPLVEDVELYKLDKTNSVSPGSSALSLEPLAPPRTSSRVVSYKETKPRDRWIAGALTYRGL